MKFDFEKIYEHIGYLFYGLASRDSNLTPSDLVKLTDFIEHWWKPDANGNHALYRHLTDCIHQGVKYAVDNKMPAHHALESFRTYFLIHAFAFGSALRSKILSAAPEIMKGSTVRWTDEVDHVLELSS